MLFAATSASPNPAGRFSTPGIPTISPFIATRQSRRTNARLFLSKGTRAVQFCVRVPDRLFRRGSLSRLIIIIAGNKRGRCREPGARKDLLPPTRDIFARALFSLSLSLSLSLFFFVPPYSPLLCIPLCKRERPRVRFHDGRSSRRSSRGSTPIFTGQSPPSAESKGTWMNGRRSVVSARVCPDK